MTREERELSIEYLEKIKEDYIEGNAYERHPLPEYYAIENAIKALKQEAKWIPVTERLPEEEGFYLVTRRITDDVATFIFRHTPTSNDYWKRCVTAWMPLPQPYKAESEVLEDGKA